VGGPRRFALHHRSQQGRRDQDVSLVCLATLHVFPIAHCAAQCQCLHCSPLTLMSNPCRCALMCETFVFKWWDALDAGTLSDCYDWSQARLPLLLPSSSPLLPSILHHALASSLVSFLLLCRCTGWVRAFDCEATCGSVFAFVLFHAQFQIIFE
jgi:hypothetical protein